MVAQVMAGRAAESHERKAHRPLARAIARLGRAADRRCFCSSGSSPRCTWSGRRRGPRSRASSRRGSRTSLDGTLPLHLVATLWRQMLGYGLAIVLGVSMGLADGLLSRRSTTCSSRWSRCSVRFRAGLPAGPRAVRRHRPRDEGGLGPPGLVLSDPAEHVQRRALDRSGAVRHRAHARPHHAADLPRARRSRRPARRSSPACASASRSR